LKLKKVATIIERRSRGKLYQTECRTTGKLYTVRYALLDVMNAGYDDGVPATILREINCLRQLESPFLQRLTAVEIE
jgi:hypothetical protein